MHRKNKSAFFNANQIILDILFLVIAYMVSYFTAGFLTKLYPIGHYTWLPMIFIPTWTLLMYVYQMYNETTFMYSDRIIKAVVKSSVFSAILIAALMYSIKEDMLSRLFFGIFMVNSIVLSISQRFLYALSKKKMRGSSGNNVLVIGSADLYNRFEYYVKKTSINMNIIGFIKMNEDFSINDEANLAHEKELNVFLKQNVVDEVIFALPRNNTCKLDKYVHYFEEIGITMRMLLDPFDLKVAKTHVSAVGTIPMVTFHSVSLNEPQMLLKRLIDIIGALTGLFFAFFIGIFVAIAIKIESKGPVFYKQKRVGLRGREFYCYKFRSMYVDAEKMKKDLEKMNQVKGGLMFKIKDDPRVTKVGKFLRKTSLDELPQFYNVLKGDMSLVGTRPPTLDEVKRYENNHKRRISIKPGITGMWQINGRSEISDFDEVVKLDIEYIDQWSIWLDMKIILKTVLVVFQRKGAF